MPIVDSGQNWLLEWRAIWIAAFFSFFCFFFFFLRLWLVWLLCSCRPLAQMPRLRHASWTSTAPRVAKATLATLRMVFQFAVLLWVFFLSSLSFVVAMPRCIWQINWRFDHYLCMFATAIAMSITLPCLLPRLPTQILILVRMRLPTFINLSQANATTSTTTAAAIGTVVTAAASMETPISTLRAYQCQIQRQFQCKCQF